MAAAEVKSVTLYAVLSSVLGSVAAEYSLILAAALVGGFAGLSIRTEKLPGWWAPTRHVVMGVLLALLLTPAGAAVALWALPEGMALPVESVLPIVAGAIGVWWHRALTEWAPRLADKLIGRGSDQ